jgi:hypothetical protein
MAASDAISILNSGLALIGEPVGVTANDGSKAWTTFNQLWQPNILRPVLAQFPWNALKRRTALFPPTLPVASGSYDSTTQNVTLTLATSYTVSAASWSANAITFTIGSHNLQVGQQITVAGVTPTGYNGSYQVVAVTSTTIVVPQQTDPGAYTSGGTVTWDIPTLSVNQTITVAGINPTDWNGTFPLTATTPNSVSYLLPVTDSYVSGGYVQWAPLFDFNCVFQLPSDWMRIYAVNKIGFSNFYGYGYESWYVQNIRGVVPPWKVEGNYLYSSESTVSIAYIANQDPPTDAVLVDLLAARTAQLMAYAMTRNDTLTQRMAQLYQQTLMRARSMNSANGTPDEFQETSWIVSRY